MNLDRIFVLLFFRERPYMETDAMYITMEEPLAKPFTMEIVLRQSMYCTQTLCASIENRIMTGKENIFQVSNAKI